MYDEFDYDFDPPRTLPAPTPQRPWLAGLIGGLVGALIVGGAWLGASMIAPDSAQTVVADTIVVSPLTSIESPPTSIVPAVIEAPTSAESPIAVVSDTEDATPTVAETGAAVVPTIVTVEVGTGSGRQFQRSGSGSGVIVDAAAGHVVTNDHVVSAGSSAQVILADGRIYDASLVGTDPLTDLAVLQISAGDLSALEWGSADSLVVGDLAIAVGSPLGLEGGPSLTVGVISAFERQVQTGPADILYGMLQTDAPITNGSSGGALVNADGRLIGITTAVGVSDNGIEGIGFATPVEIVRRVVDELIADGSVDHAFLGISGRTAINTIADGGAAPSGVEVLTVEAGSAAAGAGIEAGDVIISIDGVRVDTMEELIPLLRRFTVGEEVPAHIARAGITLEVSVILGARTA